DVAERVVRVDPQDADRRGVPRVAAEAHVGLIGAVATHAEIAHPTADALGEQVAPGLGVGHLAPVHERVSVEADALVAGPGEGGAGARPGGIELLSAGIVVGHGPAQEVVADAAVALELLAGDVAWWRIGQERRAGEA